jgi:endo-1,4-beta-mannosidase
MRIKTIVLENNTTRWIMPTEKNQTGYSLGTDGYFYHNQCRFIPAGVNYWPASCGVEVWQQWPADEIQHDLDLLVKLKLNSMRFFLRWQDFEPTAGQYDERMFQRLADWLGWFRERGLAAHPSLFVGWMSGGTFYPQWFAGRNPFSEPELVRRMEAFVCKAGEVLAPYHDSVLAVDQGNEIDCLPEAQSAPPAAVIEWCRRFNQSLRGTYPQALIVSGCDQNQVMNDTGWRLGQQPGVDFYSMHGYPVPQWHPLRFDGMTDPLMQSFLPTYVNLARAFGATMLQEFGTIATFGVKQQESYLRGMLPAAWEAGANGFLWWCLRDVTARLHPYTRNNMESTLGLVDEHDRIKPGLLHFIEFAHSLQERPPVDFTSAEAGVYISSELYPRDNARHAGARPRATAGELLP